jgi:hypothetical protein
VCSGCITKSTTTIQRDFSVEVPYSFTCKLNPVENVGHEMPTSFWKEAEYYNYGSFHGGDDLFTLCSTMGLF